MAYRCIFTLVFIALYSTSALADLFPEQIVGHWLYFKKIYRKVEMPEPPEATLRLHYELNIDGTNRLYWWHEGESDLCERKGVWILEKNVLHDRVTWVNPKNSVGCDRDPDMQLGRQTASSVSLDRAGNFLLHLSLGGEPLVYVWKKISDTRSGF